MSRTHPGITTSHIVTDRAHHLLSRAWVWVFAIPVAFVIAVTINEGLLSLQGYQLSGGAEVPAAGALMAGIPAVLVTVIPGMFAADLGFHAARQGARTGLIPAAIGIIAVALALVTNGLPAVLWLR